MGSLTANKPKPLIKVDGKALLDHALEAASSAPDVYVNAHYRADLIKAHLAATPAKLLIEHPEILESGGAVKNALAHVHGDRIATLNADAVWSGPNPLDLLAAEFDPSKMDALLLIVPHAAAHGREGGGDFVQTPDGRLQFDRSRRSFVYTGAQILSAAPIRSEPRSIFSLRDTWTDLAAIGRLYGLVYPGHWADVGHPDGIGIAESMVAEHG